MIRFFIVTLLVGGLSVGPVFAAKWLKDYAARDSVGLTYKGKI